MTTPTSRPTRRLRRDARQFDDERDTCPARKGFTTAGKYYEPGDKLDKKSTTAEFRQRMWGAGRTDYVEDYQPVRAGYGTAAASADAKKTAKPVSKFKADNKADAADKSDTKAESTTTASKKSASKKKD